MDYVVFVLIILLHLALPILIIPTILYILITGDFTLGGLLLL